MVLSILKYRRFLLSRSLTQTILAATHRYVAYTSDIGESFRPVAHPKLVSMAYGVSWAYLIGDVAFESWKARQLQLGLYIPGEKPWSKSPALTEEQRATISEGAKDWRLVGVKRAVFQSLASMGLPALTIHSTVKYAGLALKNNKNKTLRVYGPVALGLGIVPSLPYLFDEPVEHVVDYVFDKGEDMYKSAFESK